MRKAIATILCAALLCAAAAGCADPAVFETLEGMNWNYCSGAGAWSSDMQIRADGSFTCVYQDSDMGDCGDGYPDGTVYFSVFSGRMSLAEQADENTWKIRVDELVQEPSLDGIVNGIRYLPAEACGLSEGDVMTLYAPGTPVSALSEDMQFWAHVMDQENPDELENWFLSSEANDSGFVGYRAAAVGNPWQDLTAEQLEEVSGLRLNVPEGAENIVYRWMESEGIAEIQFTRENDEYCVRAQVRELQAGELADISGMYYEWQDEEETGFEDCRGLFGRAFDGERWVERVLWYDPARTLVYSLGVTTDDLGGLDLVGVAEKISQR